MMLCCTLSLDENDHHRQESNDETRFSKPQRGFGLFVGQMLMPFGAILTSPERNKTVGF